MRIIAQLIYLFDPDDVVALNASAYNNPLSIPNTNPDPERTRSMAVEEQQLRYDFRAARRDFALESIELGLYDTQVWSRRYIHFVEYERDAAFISWEAWKSVYGDIEGTQRWNEVEHSHRRIMAMCEEEILLHQQGMNVAIAAHHFNKTVASGCR